MPTLWLLLVSCVVMVGCHSREAVVVAEKTSALPVAPVPSLERSVACHVVARETVAAGTAARGTVESVLVDVGSVVTDGQVLAIVGNRAAALPIAPLAVSTPDRRQAGSLQASVAAKRLQLSRAEATFRRQELLNREGATPRLVYEAAMAERNRLAAELAEEEEASRVADNAYSKQVDQQREAKARDREAVAALASAANAEVHAPGAGLVVERNVSIGEPLTDANRNALFRITPHPELLRAEFEPLPVGTRVSIHTGAASITAVVGESGVFADFESRVEQVLPGSPCTVTVKIK